FPYAPLARGQRPKRREHRIHRLDVRIAEKELVNEEHYAKREKGEAEADPGPKEGVRGGRVTDQWLVGPVLGPRPCNARTPRHRGQRRKDDEIRGLARELG